MLIILVTGQRIQTIQKLRIDYMVCKNTSVDFCVTDLLKQSRPGNVGSTITLSAYPLERTLCVLTYLKRYLLDTSDLRANEKALFISFKRPHKAVSTDTIARWVKIVMTNAGVSTDVFKPHSTRAASTSAASNAQVPVDEILRTVGWSTEKTFQRFYNKPICSMGQFAGAVLHK